MLPRFLALAAGWTGCCLQRREPREEQGRGKRGQMARGRGDRRHGGKHPQKGGVGRVEGAGQTLKHLLGTETQTRLCLKRGWWGRVMAKPEVGR